MVTTQNSCPKGSTEGRKQEQSNESTCRRARRKGQKKKKDKKDLKVVKKVPVKFYLCTASRITNKIAVIHISEASLQKKEPMGLTGYKSVGNF